MGDHKTLKDGTVLTKPACCYGQKEWQAVMSYRLVVPSVEHAEEVRESYGRLRRSFGWPWYVSFTAVHKDTRLPYPQVFAAVKAMHTADPHAVSFTVNRMGECVGFKFYEKEA